MINPEKFHPCQNYCSHWNGEPCRTCLIAEPEYGDSTSDELGQRPSRSFDKEPAAHDAIIEFMRFPGNPQPYCAACAKKDYDMRVLRTLQAETVYVLKEKIMLREVAIGLLLAVLVLLALVLWGLK